MTIEHLNYINTDPTGVNVYFADKKTFEDIKSMGEDSLKEIFDSSSLPNVKFSSLPVSDVIFVRENDNLAVDADQNFLVGIKLI